MKNGYVITIIYNIFGNWLCYKTSMMIVEAMQRSGKGSMEDVASHYYGPNMARFVSINIILSLAGDLFTFIVFV